MAVRKVLATGEAEAIEKARSYLNRWRMAYDLTRPLTATVIVHEVGFLPLDQVQYLTDKEGQFEWPL